MPGLFPDDVSELVDDPLPEISVEELPDGGMVVTISDADAGDDEEGFAPEPVAFDANLAEKIEATQLNSIATDLIRLIQADENARAEWINMRATGIKLLGYELKQPSSGAPAQTGAVEGMSQIDHPLLAEAVDRFHSNAVCELLPADGPVKVRIDGRPTPDEDVLGNALQKDMNHYLTTTEASYYPDTDYMLFWVGLGGCSFKKIFHHPLKRRPVSESVDAADLILSPDTRPGALESGARITQKSKMRKPTLRRMQIVGAYRNVDIPAPGSTPTNAIEEQTEAVTGITVNIDVDENNRPYDILECYCDLEIPGFPHLDSEGKATGLPVPYRVVLEKNSQIVLEIRRNYNEGDPLCLPKQTYVQYFYGTGIGPYGIGLAHKLANTVIAATAGWREGLDAGMFANFPGFLYAKGIGRQNTSNMRVPPGGGVAIDTNGMHINQAVMPLPYKEMGPGMMGLIKEITDTGQRLGSIAEMTTGNGNSQAPVGTTIALIEQATVPQSAVHRRLCQAQGKEFQLLRDRFREDPEAFWRGNKKPAHKWQVQEFLAALDNYDLVPAADPNTAGAMQRAMRGQYLYSVAKDNPEAFNQGAVYRYTLRSNGIDSPDSFLAPPPDPNEEEKPDPFLIEAMAKAKDANTREQDLKVKAAKIASDDANKDEDRELEANKIMIDAGLQVRNEDLRADEERQRAAAEMLRTTALEQRNSGARPNGVN